MPVVLLHELLDGQEVGQVFESPQAGDADLLVERQDILGPQGEEMELVPNAPEKLLGVTERRYIPG